MVPALRSGVLRVDKPAGLTSHDVVAAARAALGTRRIGHTGTLDPFATGLLLLCLGRGTRLAEYLLDLPKTYVARARLGVSTDTDDVTGEVVSTSEQWRDYSAATVAAAFRAQLGERLQVPPAYSAKKVGGERLYRRARRGEPVTAPPVAVRIYRIEALAFDLPEVEFEVECSSGTYVRAIARDVGAELGCGAHLIRLRRTRIGPHTVGQAVTLEGLRDPAALEAAWVSPLAALAHLPLVRVEGEAAERLGHGATVRAPAGAPAAGLVAVASGAELLAVAEAADGTLRPRKVLAGE
ncbi:MAG: tRNA pseudouridine(55) synthase TruB [Gemmatimonadetes bacterium]|nr:tRNA pseudouridine(55) synthase TruB [Gemmatimonadota bacterium]